MPGVGGLASFNPSPSSYRQATAAKQHFASVAVSKNEPPLSDPGEIILSTGDGSTVTAVGTLVRTMPSGTSRPSQRRKGMIGRPRRKPKRVVPPPRLAPMPTSSGQNAMLDNAGYGGNTQYQPVPIGQPGNPGSQNLAYDTLGNSPDHPYTLDPLQLTQQPNLALARNYVDQPTWYSTNVIPTGGPSYIPPAPAEEASNYEDRIVEITLFDASLSDGVTCRALITQNSEVTIVNRGLADRLQWPLHPVDGNEHTTIITPLRPLRCGQFVNALYRLGELLPDSTIETRRMRVAHLDRIPQHLLGVQVIIGQDWIHDPCPSFRTISSDGLAPPAPHVITGASTFGEDWGLPTLEEPLGDPSQQNFYAEEYQFAIPTVSHYVHPGFAGLTEAFAQFGNTVVVNGKRCQWIDDKLHQLDGMGCSVFFYWRDVLLGRTIFF